MIVSGHWVLRQTVKNKVIRDVFLTKQEADSFKISANMPYICSKKLSTKLNSCQFRQILFHQIFFPPKFLPPKVLYVNELLFIEMIVLY